MKPLPNLLAALVCTFAPQASAADKPNIIFIMADDIGWKDVGFAGARFFETPHIDGLTRQGMAFDAACSGGANCAPIRACLMSETYTPRHTIYQPGGLAKGPTKRMKLLVPAHGKRSPELKEMAARQFPITTVLDPKFTCIPEVLKSAGYTTARLGKWHLGAETKAPIPATPNPDYMGTVPNGANLRRFWDD